MKKELEAKHAKEMSEMAEKVKNNNNRVKTLASKLKAAKAEAADVDKLIFRKDFTSLWHVYCILLFPTRNLIT
jgi:ATP-dependent RNA circularization protein (DNA/RNA ligase family)